MVECKIGETFEQKTYEEMASSQMGIAADNFLAVTLTYCPTYIPPITPITLVSLTV